MTLHIMYDAYDLESPEMNDLAEILADEIKAELNFSVLSHMLERTGWTKVTLPSLTVPNDGVDLHEDWAKKNCIGKYHNHANNWVFEEAKDAEWFILKWR